MPKVSVIVPFFNRINWTYEAINSILSQTYKDFEILIIDDGSTDQYKNNFEKLDDRIRFFKIDHLGRSSARNIGLTKSKGNYITFLDSDDLYAPRKLEKQIHILDSNINFGMVYTNYQTMNEQGEISSNFKIPNIALHGDIYPDLLFVKGTCITTPSVMVRKEILDVVGIFDVNMDICEDLDLWRRISKVTLIYQIHEPLVFIRSHNIPNSYWKFTKGRSYYLNKAFRDDHSLPTITRKELFIDMYFTYFKWSIKQLDLFYALYAFYRLLFIDKSRFYKLFFESINKSIDKN